MIKRPGGTFHGLESPGAPCVIRMRGSGCNRSAHRLCLHQIAIESAGKQDLSANSVNEASNLSPTTMAMKM